MKPQDQPMIVHALRKFAHESALWILDMEVKDVGIVQHRGLSTPYCTFADSNVIFCTFHSLKNS